MLSRVALIVAVLLLAVSGIGATIDWKASTSIGKPWAGSLVDGVRLPAEGELYFTWDPVRKTSPNRPWRRWGSDRLLRALFRVLEGYFEANPDAPRVGIGDLSRPRGGDFGPRYGGIGHASHQNGLDVDVYYPRLDGRERPPVRPQQVDRRLAQELVTRFVRAGAVKVFVGPRVRLRGPRRVVGLLPHHDNHLHVRIGRDRSRVVRLGRSARGRRIEAVRIGKPRARPRVLVVGCIHGDECAGTAVTQRLRESRPRAELWLLDTVNPDGFALDTRQNARGVDLNRNFAAGWRRTGRPWSPEYSGARPFSEPETRLARRVILWLRPDLTIWFHQPQGLVRAWGPSIPAARRYARAAALPFRAIRWPRGTAPRWQNQRFPGAPSFVVELPAGPLSSRAVARHERAILSLAR